MEFLVFLARPAFVIPWYAFGVAAAAWVWWDLQHANTALKQAIRWAWPLIVLFFAPIGLALYLLTARAPGIGRAQGQEERQARHARYEQSMLRRVNGAVIHCVAGDGLGIMTAMVIARLLELTFWQEFWFEYAVGFAFGWFIFQYRSMRMMTDSAGMALAMAFRAEFFSMLTVMAGMGAVMTWVTPSVVGMQPKPDTAAFWGFGMLGLLVGYLFTLPMNWMMVKIGWKHGMGPKEGARPAESRGAHAVLLAAMAGLGAVALVVPAWLALARADHERAAVRGLPAPAPATAAADMLQEGVQASLAASRAWFARGARQAAVAALDDARRALAVAHEVAPGPGTRARRQALEQVFSALQNGDTAGAVARLEAMPAGDALPPPRPPGSVDRSRRVPRFEGVDLVNTRGAVIGEIRRIEGARMLLALGGRHDVWGFWDMAAAQQVWVDADVVLLGPREVLGKSFAMLPTAATPPLPAPLLAQLRATGS